MLHPVNDAHGFHIQRVRCPRPTRLSIPGPAGDQILLSNHHLTPPALFLRLSAVATTKLTPLVGDPVISKSWRWVLPTFLCSSPFVRPDCGCVLRALPFLSVCPSEDAIRTRFIFTLILLIQNRGIVGGSEKNATLNASSSPCPQNPTPLKNIRIVRRQVGKLVV
jgi:hypothetical protein